MLISIRKICNTWSGDNATDMQNETNLKCGQLGRYSHPFKQNDPALLICISEEHVKLVGSGMGQKSFSECKKSQEDTKHIKNRPLNFPKPKDLPETGHRYKSSPSDALLALHLMQ